MLRFVCEQVAGPERHRAEESERGAGPVSAARGQGVHGLRRDPVRPARGSSLTGKGIFLDADGTLRKTKSGELYPRGPEEVGLLPGRRAILEHWVNNRAR